jgi:hypothetical protein
MAPQAAHLNTPQKNRAYGVLEAYKYLGLKEPSQIKLAKIAKITQKQARSIKEQRKKGTFRERRHYEEGSDPRSFRSPKTSGAQDVAPTESTDQNSNEGHDTGSGESSRGLELEVSTETPRKDQA